MIILDISECNKSFLGEWIKDENSIESLRSFGKLSENIIKNKQLTLDDKNKIMQELHFIQESFGAYI